MSLLFLDPYPAFPAELKVQRRFVLYALKPHETKPGKVEKIPRRARRPHLGAASTRPAEWVTYAEAVEALQSDAARAAGCVGLGYVFVGEVGVDVDACIDASGQPDALAREILALLPDTYCERSPSSTGLHFFARGTLPPGRRKRERVEMYSEGRFFTITGDVYGGAPSVVAACQAGIDAVHKRFLSGEDGDETRRNRKLAVSLPRETMPITDDDQAVLERMFTSLHGSRIRSLYRGDTSSHEGDASAADLALANHLLYWLDGDVGRADRLFRGSGLYRAKWDERRGQATYGQLTLATALEGLRGKGHSRSGGARLVARASCSVGGWPWGGA